MSKISIYTVGRVWDKATIVPNYNPDIWRKDFAGAWIRKDAYGQRTKYGWEVDHLVPVSHGGSDDLSNLTALHWQNNVTKGQDYPIFKTSVTSEDNRNISLIKSWQLR